MSNRLNNDAFFHVSNTVKFDLITIAIGVNWLITDRSEPLAPTPLELKMIQRQRGKLILKRKPILQINKFFNKTIFPAFSLCKLVLTLALLHFIQSLSSQVGNI